MEQARSSEARGRHVALDGLRGIAAAGVVVLHNRGAFGGDAVFGHAYLAVDLFFILSGFVLARAYAGRVADGRAAAAFLIHRAIRLVPLLALGALLGGLVIPTDAGAGSPALAVLVNAVGIPAWWQPDPFAANPPTWSLCGEIVACIVFALVGANRVRLPALPLIGALGGLMIGIALLAHHIDVGPGHAPGGLLLGAPRVALAFLIGVTISRPGIAERAFAPAFRPWLGLVLLVCLTLLPNRTYWATFYDPLVAYVLFPLLILAGARTLCRFPGLMAAAGALSYPLYILHHPLIRVMDGAVATATGAPPTPMLQVAIVLATVPLSYLALRCYDEPVRTRLDRLARRRHGSSGTQPRLAA